MYSPRELFNCLPVYHQFQSLIGFQSFDIRAMKKWNLSQTLSLSPCFRYEMKKLFIWGHLSAHLRHRCNQTSIQIAVFANAHWLPKFEGDKDIFFYQLCQSLLASKHLWNTGHAATDINALGERTPEMKMWVIISQMVPGRADGHILARSKVTLDIRRRFLTWKQLGYCSEGGEMEWL